MASATDSAKHSAATRRHTFAELESKPTMRLRVTDGPPALGFGLRADERAIKAALKIHYSFSPTLIAEQSHIKVLLNHEIIGTLPMTRESTGHIVTKSIELDPASLKGYNEVALEFVGHYASECEDPLHANMWADIARGSEVEMTVQRTALKNDLALLPEPFFDRNDSRRLSVPYVFAARPSHATLKAAGVTASWFGIHAAWRNARFPTYLDTLPAGHAVVFATNAERPQFLAGQAAYSGPALSIITNPRDEHAKLLLITGRDSADLAVAANALVLGTAALSGAQVSVSNASKEQPRKPYDAPNWVRIDRPMKFGELVKSPQQLQVYGHVPQPVNINLRIPPDLFTWRSRGVVVDLKLRYTPPIRTSDSRVSMSINGELVQSVNLRASGQGGESARVILPLLDGGLLGDSREMLIPAFKLGSRNQLQYAFGFGYHVAGACRDTQVENIRAMIDADSRIDFSGYPHYAEMPHLGYFATAGFPFTKLADLSETIVVMPETVTAQDIEVMLALLGRMSESTGYPATRVQVTGPGDDKVFSGHDLLVIGATSRQRLLEHWQARLPVAIASAKQNKGDATGTMNFAARFWRGLNQYRGTGSGERRLLDKDASAAFLGFESPLGRQRSVVAVTAVEPKDMAQILDILESEDAIKSMHGGVVLVQEGVTESIATGSAYSIGKLPLWTRIWFPLSGQPVLLAVMSVLAVLVFAFALWRTLKAVAARRLNDN